MIGCCGGGVVNGHAFRCWCVIDIYGCCLFSVSPIPVHFHYALCIMNYALRTLSGGYSGGVPPLPIPNSEVKPVIADGTAMQCGRVGSRLLSVERFPNREVSPFFCLEARGEKQEVSKSKIFHLSSLIFHLSFLISHLSSLIFFPKIHCSLIFFLYFCESY